jgi:hypothetical protein
MDNTKRNEKQICGRLITYFFFVCLRYTAPHTQKKNRRCRYSEAYEAMAVAKEDHPIFFFFIFLHSMHACINKIKGWQQL